MNIRITAFSVLALLSASLLFSCQQREESKPVEFGVTPTEVSFDCFGGQEVLTLTCSEDWVARCGKGWIKATPSTGKGSASEIKVSVVASKNPDASARNCVISFETLSGKKIEVSVNQAAASDDPEPTRGIASAQDLLDFAAAVNGGESLSRFMVDGEIVLCSDIDASSITDWTPAGTKASPFTGVLNGKGFSIKNIKWTSDVSKTADIGLIGYGSGAKIKNLTMGAEGDVFKVKGMNSAPASFSAFVGYSKGCTFGSCVNNVDLLLEGDSMDGVYFAMGGIAGLVCEGSVIGGAMNSCVNNGDVMTGRLSNKGNGSTGLQCGGIGGYVNSLGADCLVSYCTNNGHIAAPAGRGGGITGTLEKGTIDNCVNNGLVEDDIVGQYTGVADAYKLKRMGGISGSTGTSASVLSSINNGNVISRTGCRTGGFVSHSTGVVKNCVNRGCVIADSGADGHGPAWGCAYNPTADNFTGNKGYGHVGSYALYGSNPQSAPAATYFNAVVYPGNAFDPEQNQPDWTTDDYYGWKEIESKDLCSGLKYTKFTCTGVPRLVCVLEVDLTNPGVSLTTSFADDCVPNPNGNANNNNGYNLRETLSKLCVRKRAEGDNIVAGINTGFFDSNDGIARGYHVEEGQPVYINNPKVVSSLTNHGWAFTVFTDGTASCAKKSFVGKLKVAGAEYSYYTINDTTLRHVSSYQANLYTSKYKMTPHPEKPSLVNDLASNAYYVIAQYVSDPMKVNCGYAQAKVISIHDGRSSGLSQKPYITADNQVGIALSGSTASSVAAALKVGDTVELRCDITIEGEKTRPIYTLNSTMFRIMQDGRDNSNSIPTTNQSVTLYDPLTFPVVSQDGKKVWLVEVDGRQGWTSMGVKAYEMFRIAQKLGGYNVTRFDGGGSSTMWVYDKAAGKGSVVNHPSDTKGERSCMNYILLRANN